MQANREREQATLDDAKCLSYGAHFGDPAYVQCRAQLDAARTQARATDAAGAAAASASMESGPVQVQPMPPIYHPPSSGGLWHPGQF